jgi:glycosyltransferase involved in cell wall biosynthesis
VASHSLKIVMIGPFAFDPKGTVSVRTFFIARALARRGRAVTILMPPYDNLVDSGRVWEEDGVRLENMTIRRNDLFHQIIVPAQMARRAAALDPDIIHVFKPIGYSGLAGIYLRWFSHRPLVLDTDDWEGAGGWADVNPYPAPWRRLFDWQERWLARHADAVTVVSRTLQEQVIGFGADPERVVYLPNGPDARLRQRAPVSDEQIAEIRAQWGVGDAPVALYLGTIPHGTDLDLALEALHMLRDRLPEARLVIAGVGEGLPLLQAQAERLNLGERVVFPGWVEPEQAHAQVVSADVVVNPYRDSLINRSKCAGKVILGMAIGKAVVTSRLGANLEYIEDGHSGVLTEPGDPGDLARGLLSVLSDREWAAELGRNARRRVWEQFDWDSQIGDVERAYQIALERRES